MYISVFSISNPLICQYRGKFKYFLITKLTFYKSIILSYIVELVNKNTNRDRHILHRYE